MHLLANATFRAALSVGALSAWMVLLFAGWVGGGAVHLLFAASLALFPWRAALAPATDGEDELTAPEDERT